MLDPIAVKKDFPIFEANPGLVYLDSAATSQKPKVVIDAVSSFYSEENANVHRGVYELSEKATKVFEGGRKRVAEFLNAVSDHEIIFTKNATEAINLLRFTWAEDNLCENDTIVLSVAEHHSNFVPWLDLAYRKGVSLRVIDEFNSSALVEAIDESVKLVAVSQLSNALGTYLDLDPVIERAHEVGARVLVDACQSVCHQPVDVQKLDCDFLVFSGHKVYGPTGIGVLYAKYSVLNECRPFLMGGDMIRYVKKDDADYMDMPARFEAGTPNVAGAVGLAAALDYVERIGRDDLMQHSEALCDYAFERLNELDFMRVVGPQDEGVRLSAVSFVVDGVHPHDVAQVLSDQNIAVRAGHHCAQPLMDMLGVTGTVRASFGVYNSTSDVDDLIDGLKKVNEVFNK